MRVKLNSSGYSKIYDNGTTVSIVGGYENDSDVQSWLLIDGNEIEPQFTEAELIINAREEEKQELDTFCDTLEDIEVNGNAYSVKTSSLEKIKIQINSPWKNATKEWYEQNFTVCFITNKVDLGLVAIKADELIQDEYVRIFGGVE